MVGYTSGGSVGENARNGDSVWISGTVLRDNVTEKWSAHAVGIPRGALFNGVEGGGLWR